MATLKKISQSSIIQDLYDPLLNIKDSTIECESCRPNNIYCPGHFKLDPDTIPIFNILYLSHVKKILRCICLKCSNLIVCKNDDDIVDMLKTTTYCLSCGTPVSKIQTDKKPTGNISFISETNIVNIGPDDRDLKKKNIQILTPAIVFDIFKNISDINCKILGFDPVKSRPEYMIVFI
jgi:DNA-directed RNA polymerase II subunit RPB1